MKKTINSIIEKIRNALKSHYLNIIVIILVVLSTILVTITLVINLELASLKTYPIVSSLKIAGASNTLIILKFI